MKAMPQRRRGAGAARGCAHAAVAVAGLAAVLPALAQQLPAPAPPAEGAVLATGSEALRSGRSEPLWELGFGAAAVRFPDYRGSDEASTYVLPLPFVAYRGRFLRADRDGARAILFAGRRLEIDVSLNASTPTKSKDNDARSGMRNLPGTFEIGPNANIELWQSGDRRYRVDLRLPVREAITIEKSPHAIGVTFQPNLNLDIRNFDGAWNIGMLAGPLFASRRYHQHFYGVDADDATASRPAYDARGGYSGWRATMAFSRRIGPAWLGGFVRYDDLSGARFAASPLVRTERAWFAGFGISWLIASSDARVVTDD